MASMMLLIVHKAGIIIISSQLFSHRLLNANHFIQLGCWGQSLYKGHVHLSRPHSQLQIIYMPLN